MLNPHFDLPFRLTGSIPNATNLVPNGGFEVDASGWGENTNIGGTLNDLSRSTAWMQFGSASLHFKWTAPNDTTQRSAGIISSLGVSGIPVLPSTAYVVSAYINTVNPGTTGDLILYFWRSDGTQVAGTALNIAGSPSGRYSLTVVSSSDSVFASVAMHLSTNVANDVLEFYVDGVQLERGSVATPYINTINKPVSRAGNVCAAVAEQGSFEDIGNCVEAIVRTPLGFRDDAPQFGFPDLTLSNQPVITTDVIELVQAQEPRAAILISERPDVIDQLIDRLTVEVS